jgi:hypothetical protein
LLSGYSPPHRDGNKGRIICQAKNHGLSQGAKVKRAPIFFKKNFISYSFMVIKAGREGFPISKEGERG